MGAGSACLIYKELGAGSACNLLRFKGKIK